jgi:hypothetical protein
MNDLERRVVLHDIVIPFGRLVAVLLKIMIAAIPALLLFYAVIGVIVLVVAAFFGAAAAIPHSPQRY